MIYIPREQVSWVSGYDLLKTFRFNNKRLAHKFCPECGSSMIIDAEYAYKDVPRYKGAPDIICLNVGGFPCLLHHARWHRLTYLGEND
jgi:hypothetical protein